jgi:hypothetical protein
VSAAALLAVRGGGSFPTRGLLLRLAGTAAGSSVRSASASAAHAMGYFLMLSFAASMRGIFLPSGSRNVKF